MHCCIYARTNTTSHVHHDSHTYIRYLTFGGIDDKFVRWDLKNLSKSSYGISITPEYIFTLFDIGQRFVNTFNILFTISPFSARLFVNNCIRSVYSSDSSASPTLIMILCNGKSDLHILWNWICITRWISSDSKFFGISMLFLKP